MTPQETPAHETDAASRAEAFLFAEGGPLSLKKLATLLGASAEDTRRALAVLAERLAGRGVELIWNDSEASLVISAALGGAVEKAYEREMGRDIGDAGLEVLSILLYGGPTTRARIDYIRGVNTSSTIRLLLSRSLIERTSNPSDAREYLYKPTLELMAHLGVTKAENLPEYAKISNDLATFQAEQAPFRDAHGTESDHSTNTAGDDESAGSDGADSTIDA